MCYTYDGELYTQEANARPKKVNVELVGMMKKEIASLKFSQGATSASVSRTANRLLSLCVVMSLSLRRITLQQSKSRILRERSRCVLCPDNRTLVYASERTGNWQLYTAKIARKEEANFPNATLIEEEVLLPSKTVERAYPQYSPDGKGWLFIEDRNRLMVLDLKTKKVRQVTDGSTAWYNTGGGFDYEWSPDGKWFTLEFIGNRHDPYSDIGIVSAQRRYYYQLD